MEEIEELKWFSAEFEKLRLMAVVRLEANFPFMAKHLQCDLNPHVEFMMNELVARLTSRVLGKNTGNRVDIEEKWPVDWWEAFRERWFPKFWLRWYPIRYRTISIHKVVYRVCPHLPYHTDRTQDIFHIRLMNDGTIEQYKAGAIERDKEMNGD
jgi:hypothetical protein